MSPRRHTAGAPGAAATGLAPSPFEAAFYGDDVRMVAPGTYAELVDLVREAEAAGTPLVPAGLGSHAYLGNPPPRGALVVSLREFRKVLRYEPDDFTAGVEAGLPLEELRASLRANRQEVPVDLPGTARGTVGGLVAAAPAGPRRARWGPLRASVIGVHALGGGPRRFKSGGMVVKNVAGYEVHRFLCGTLGTAGIVLEVNFKLRPLPERRSASIALFAAPAAAWKAARRLPRERLDPAGLMVLAGAALRDLAARLPDLDLAGAERAVALLFEGNAAAVAWQEREAARLVAEEGGAPPRPLPPEGVDALHDFLSSFAEPGPGVPRDLGIARLAVLPSAAAALEETVLGLCNAPPEAAAGVRAAAGRAGAQGSTATDALTGLLTVRWRGKEGSLAAPLPALKEVAGLPASSGTLIYLPPEERRNWDYLLQPDPNRELAESVLRVFDPRGIFSPGRLRGAARAAPA